MDFRSPCLAYVGAFLSAYSLVPTRVLYHRTFRNYRGRLSDTYGSTLLKPDV